MEPVGQPEVTSASAGIKDHAYSLLRALIRSHYFGDTLPTVQKLIHTTRIPKSAVEEALMRLENEDLIEKVGTSYRQVFIPDSERQGRAVFLLNSNIFATWYGIFQDYLIGFEEILNEQHVDTIFRSEFESVEQKFDTLREFRNNRINGVAFASFTEPSLRQYVIHEKIPTVLLGNATLREREIGCVSSDNQGGIESVVNHLLDLNHRQIAYYTTAVYTHDGFNDRLIGYELGMRRAGLKPVYDLVFAERHHTNMANRAALIFQSMDPRPTAIVCSCDREAFELMSELRQSGFKIPDQVAITGADNSIFGAIGDPPLTSLDPHPRQIGRFAANYLLNEMHAPQMPVRILLPTDLVERESVKLLPGTPAPIVREQEVPTRKTAKFVLPEEEELAQF
jgi:LacI family transcriptional regulator